MSMYYVSGTTESLNDSSGQSWINLITNQVILLQWKVNTKYFCNCVDCTLVVIEKSSGNIIRVTDVFSGYKIKKRKEIKPVGFIVGKKNIYLTTDHGRLMIIDTKLGKTKSILKLDNDKISRPFILGKNLYVVKNNAIIKLDWCFLNCWKK